MKSVVQLRFHSLWLVVALVAVACAKNPSGGPRNGSVDELPAMASDAGVASDFGNADSGIEHLNPVRTGEGGDGPGGDSGVAGNREAGCIQELCHDGLDNDCDALADEGCACTQGTQQPCYAGPSENAGVGACQMGQQRCSHDLEFNTWGECSGSRLPLAEICDNEVDDDCDGTADEGCICTPPETRACYGGPDRTRGVGACRDGTLACELRDGDGVWGDDCDGEVLPATELCGNDVDEDCDGELDDDCICESGETAPCYTGPSQTRGIGVCHDGVVTCELNDGVAEWGKDCVGAALPATELCGNEVDEDCDHDLDNGCVCTRGQTQACYAGSSATRGVGACHDGLVTCEIGDGNAAWGVQCVGAATPHPELCGNDIDEDCDGNLDNGCICEQGETDACYPGASNTRGMGACHDGEISCEVSGGVAVWGEDCAGAVTPESEICGNDTDEDCDGELDNGCADIECPEDMTVAAGEAVVLTVTGDQVMDYAFAITDGPDGGAATAVWSGLDPAQPSAQLTPYIIGEYTIRVTAEDASGDPHVCSFNLTALPHGLRVQLFWDGSGDVDLHLHNNGASPWFNLVDDCFYSNRNTAWGAVLDFDNIPGPGPENITIDNPVIGTTYVIGVHNYSMAAGRIATVNVFCGDTAGTIPQQTFVSHPLVGAGGGNCTANDFWHVARVTFTSLATCTIEPIDDYVPSTTACAEL